MLKRNSSLFCENQPQEYNWPRMTDQKGFTFVPILIAVVAGILFTGATIKGLIPIDLSGNRSSVQKVNATPTPTPSESPTPIPTYPPTQIPKIKPVYVDPDPIVNCNISSNCGGGNRQMKKSECNQSTCCQLGNAWSIYPNKTACTQAQNNYNSSKTSGANYPPCTVYYPALHISSTYSYTSPETCKQWQDTANAGSTNTLQPTQQPTTAPTQDNAEYNNLLKQHQEACQRVVAEWNTIKENFYANEYNNYSSSAEAIQELERRRQTYQQEAYSVGCTQTISL